MLSAPRRLVLPVLALAGCATTPSAEPYRASGYEPGWTLEIAGGRILYVGDYGEVRIDLPAPTPRPTENGRRYEVAGTGHNLAVEITRSVCRSASGTAFADTVTGAADGKKVEGCGGAQLASRVDEPPWLMAVSGGREARGYSSMVEH